MTFETIPYWYHRIKCSCRINNISLPVKFASSVPIPSLHALPSNHSVKQIPHLPTLRHHAHAHPPTSQHTLLASIPHPITPHPLSHPSSPVTFFHNLPHPISPISLNPTSSRPFSSPPSRLPIAFCGDTMDVVDMPARFSDSSRRIRMPAAEMPIVRAKRGSRVLWGS